MGLRPAFRTRLVNGFCQAVSSCTTHLPTTFPNPFISGTTHGLARTLQLCMLPTLLCRLPWACLQRTVGQSYWRQVPFWESLQKMYEGGEFFKFFASAADVRTKKSPSVNTWFSWERTSQWLPWMKMGDRPGTLFASTTGSRVSSLNDLPKFIQKDISDRLPLYAQAPHCMQDIPDSTSWTYFSDHFAEYLAGDQFPVPAPNVSVPCKWKPVKHQQ